VLIADGGRRVEADYDLISGKPAAR